MTSAPLPTSGDPGGRPPRAEALPTPALWPADEGAETPFDSLREDSAPSRDRVSVRGAWGAAALMALGTVLLGVAAVVLSLWLAVAGVVVGLAGLVLARRVRMFAAVRLGTAQERSGGSA